LRLPGRTRRSKGSANRRIRHRPSRLPAIYCAVHWQAKAHVAIYESPRERARNRRQPKSGPLRRGQGKCPTCGLFFTGLRSARATGPANRAGASGVGNAQERSESRFHV
jgi:hypothetical protein